VPSRNPTRFLAILTLVCGSPLQAGAADVDAQTTAYLRARDRYIAVLDALDHVYTSQYQVDVKEKGLLAAEDTLNRAHSRVQQPMLNDLQDRLTKIIGTPDLPGLPQTSINPGTLWKHEIGYGMLDGVRYASKDNRTKVVVTTRALLIRWIADNREHLALPNLPADERGTIASVFASDSFYTLGIDDDAAFAKFGDLAVQGRDKSALLQVSLALVSQDDPYPPDTIAVAALRGDRVYVLTQSLAFEPAAFADCDKIIDKLEERTIASYQAMSLAPPSDKTTAPGNYRNFAAWSDQKKRLFRPWRAAEPEAFKAYRRCFFAHAQQQPYYQAILRQARALAAMVP